MINNYWEELNMDYDVGAFHEEVLNRDVFPEWLNLNCPFCGIKLPRRGIRSISVKLNTRNLGDIAVEFCCTECRKMDTLYYRQELTTIRDISDFLGGNKIPHSEPLLEEKMYKARYNNLVELMLKEREIGRASCRERVFRTV